jgi:hypothetical protein
MQDDIKICDYNNQNVNLMKMRCRLLDINSISDLTSIWLQIHFKKNPNNFCILFRQISPT